MDLIAAEVMRRSLKTVPDSMPLAELERTFVDSGVSGFPVLKGEQLVGVVSRADIVRQLNNERETAQRTSDFYRVGNELCEATPETGIKLGDRIGERMEQLTVADVMHTRLFAVSRDQTLRAVAEIMVDNDIHRVLVTQSGKLLGIIAASDIVRLYAQGRLKPV